MDFRQEKIILAIREERARQRELLRQGRIKIDMSSHHVPYPERLMVLTEEVGEVARAIQDGKGDDLRTELVQCAAVCLAFLEGL